MRGSTLAWLLTSLPFSSNQEYLTYVDPTARHGLRRSVANPDGTMLRLQLENRGSSVRVFSLSSDGSVQDEMDVSAPELQTSLLSSERDAHGIAYWQPLDEVALAGRHALWRTGRANSSHCAVPEDIHLEETAPKLYDAIFSDLSIDSKKTNRLLQVGDMTFSSDDDVARILVRSKELHGLVLVGSLPKTNPESQWTQGPMLEGYDASVEGGALMFEALTHDWRTVDVLRLDQNLPGACHFLKGLLAAGLQTAMIVMFLNSQFPPPLRYSSMSQQKADLQVPFFGCSLSYAIDLLRPYGFHLARLSGPYSAFIHESKLASKIGPRRVDEFACYRDSQVWGFEHSFPIENVREWFFRRSGESVQEIWRRCWGNLSAYFNNSIESHNVVLSF